MELYQIRHFVAVVEAGGFTKGAQRVAVSQPAISASIAKLEAELNVKLLDRQHSEVVLTDAGKRFLEAGRAILRSCHAIKSELKTISRGAPLRIGVMQAISCGEITRFLNAFRDANPSIAMEIEDGHCDEWCHCEQLFAPLMDGRRDAAISILTERIPKGFESRPLFTRRYMLAVRDDHPFAARSSVAIEELDGIPLILPNRCIYLQNLIDAVASRRIRIRAAYRTDCDDRALALAAAGAGLALVPAPFEMPGVTGVPVLGLDVSRTAGLVWPRDRQSSALRTFLAFAAGYLRARLPADAPCAFAEPAGPLAGAGPQADPRHLEGGGSQAPGLSNSSA
ncbi:MAG TPA: LysR family transcriptional regulator [Methylocella sp.]|nr:LysR family transcriptional regulator [Methylocella sp.]